MSVAIIRHNGSKFELCIVYSSDYKEIYEVDDVMFALTSSSSSSSDVGILSELSSVVSGEEDVDCCYGTGKER